MPDLTGATLGSYRILGKIGKGGMATVYQAYDPTMDREVAIKVLPEEFASDPGFLARFEREAKVVAKLQHPNILPVFDYGEDRDITYLVMPYIAGGTLKDYLGATQLDFGDVVRIFSQIADALDYAHQVGVLHRDIKPSNVLIDSRGNALLTDFGLTRMVEHTSNLTGTGVIGTPAYMSPEQGRGLPLDTRSDIYSLGVTLYEMVVGEVPFSAETPVAVIFKHTSEPLPLPRTHRPDLPEAAERVILKALSKNPDDRYSTCGEMGAAFQAAMKDAPISDRSIGESITRIGTQSISEAMSLPDEGATVTPTAATLQSTASGRSRTVLGVVVIAILLGIAGILFFLLGNGDNEGSNAIVETSLTSEVSPSVAPSDTPALTDTPTAADTATSIPTVSAREIAQATLDQEGTIQAEFTAIAAENRETALAAQTATADSWTDTPIPSSTATLTLAPTQTPTPVPTETHTPTPLPTETSTPMNIATLEPTSESAEVAAVREPVAHNADWTPVIQEFDGVEMVLVPPGCFMMGENSEGGEQCFSQPFWIDRYELTNSAFQVFVDDGGYHNEAYWSNIGWIWKQANSVNSPQEFEGFTDANQPRVGVSWFEAQAYANWRGCQLASEAQWEYAARGPDNLVFPWGNEFDADNIIYEFNSNGVTAEVGSRPGGVSWVGALDLTGNALEWTSTASRDYPYDAEDGREAQDYSPETLMVTRGGYIHQGGEHDVIAAFRGGDVADIRVDDLGFRCAHDYSGAYVIDSETRDYVQGTILFEDDFETGELRLGATLWQLVVPLGWNVIQNETGNYLLHNDGSNVDRNFWSFIAGGDARWTNYALELDIRVREFGSWNQMEVGVRNGNPSESDCFAYYVGLSSTDTLLVKGGEGDCGYQFLDRSEPITPNTWYHLRIEAYDNQIMVYLNSELILSIEDDELSAGRFYFSLNPGTAVDIDNVQVTELVHAPSE